MSAVFNTFFAGCGGAPDAIPDGAAQESADGRLLDEHAGGHADHHADIHLVVEDLGHHFRRIGDIQLHVGVRVLGQVVGQVAGGKVVADGEAGAYLEVPDLLVHTQ